MSKAFFTSEVLNLSFLCFGLTEVADFNFLVKKNLQLILEISLSDRIYDSRLSIVRLNIHSGWYVSLSFAQLFLTVLFHTIPGH